MKFVPALACLLVFGLSSWAAPQPLHLVKTIPLPGTAGRLDHLAVDVRTKRVFVAALENNTLEAVDVAAGQRRQSVPGLAKPAGVLYLPDTNRIFVANSDDATLQILDGTTLKHLKTIYSLLDADNLRYDPATRSIYVGYGSGAVGWLENSMSSLSKSYRVHGHPEAFQLESKGPRIFVNVPTAGEVAVLDRTPKSPATVWKLGEFGGNFPMALAESDRRLFVGCRKPAALVVLDSDTGKTVASVRIAGDCDDLFHDAKRQRIYVSCGEGFLEVIERSAPDKYERLATVETRVGARTGWFSPELDQFFLAVPAVEGHPAELRVYQPE